MKIHSFKRCPLTKLNSSGQNFMKLCHIVQYHDIFFKFDNGLYGTMLLGVIALSYEKSSVETTSAFSDK